MYVVAALIANRESTVLRKPGQSTLHYPPVSPQLLGALYALSCYTALYRTPSQGFFTLLVVVSFVSMWLLRTPPRSAPARTLDGFYTVEEFFENHRVMDVCGGEHHRQWDAPSVRNKVALGALLCFICRIVGGFWAPFWQGWKPNRVRHAPSRSAQPLLGAPEELGAASPTPQPLAIP
jgi:hypothetical protein